MGYILLYCIIKYMLYIYMLKLSCNIYVHYRLCIIRFRQRYIMYIYYIHVFILMLYKQQYIIRCVKINFWYCMYTTERGILYNTKWSQKLKKFLVSFIFVFKMLITSIYYMIIRWQRESFGCCMKYIYGGWFQVTKLN